MALICVCAFVQVSSTAPATSPTPAAQHVMLKTVSITNMDIANTVSRTALARDACCFMRLPPFKVQERGATWPRVPFSSLFAYIPIIIGRFRNDN